MVFIGHFGKGEICLVQPCDARCATSTNQTAAFALSPRLLPLSPRRLRLRPKKRVDRIHKPVILHTSTTGAHHASKQPAIHCRRVCLPCRRQAPRTRPAAGLAGRKEPGLGAREEVQCSHHTGHAQCSTARRLQHRWYSCAASSVNSLTARHPAGASLTH